MRPFATVPELEARWRPLSVEEGALAEALLTDAAYMLSKQVIVDETDDTQAYLLMVISCNMVKRAMMNSGTDMLGITQTSMTAGPYTQSYTYQNPSGDMYITNRERRLLGIGTLKIGSISPNWGIFQNKIQEG